MYNTSRDVALTNICRATNYFVDFLQYLEHKFFRPVLNNFIWDLLPKLQRGWTRTALSPTLGVYRFT